MLFEIHLIPLTLLLKKIPINFRKDTHVQIQYNFVKKIKKNINNIQTV